MEFTIQELNELYYCLRTIQMRNTDQGYGQELREKLIERFEAETVARVMQEAQSEAE